jgi:hypothetical protein
MGANHGDGVAGLPFVANSESDDGGWVPTSRAPGRS